MRKSGSETILVVDDESNTREFIESVLMPLGYNVVVSASGEEALQLTENEKMEVDLLLSDVVLPGIKGHELAEKFKNLNPDIKCLFMSGYLCPSIAMGSENREGAFLKKPFSRATLVDKMRKMLR